ncbi:MAG: glycosyltransferase family 4 protein [Bacteroidales bacterium]
MKIGYYAHSAFCNSRGLGSYSRTLINAMRMQHPDNQYTLFTPSTNDYELYANYSDVEIIEPEGMLSKLDNYWKKQICKHVDNESIEVFHGLANELPIIKDSKCKRIVTIHDLAFMKEKGGSGAVDKFLNNKKISEACTNADHIIAVSKQTKEDLITLLKVPAHKISVIYQAVTTIHRNAEEMNIHGSKIRELGLPENYLLYVGAIEPHKNIEAILRAIKQTDEKHHLLIAGRKSGHTKSIMELADNLNLSERIHILHDLDNESIVGLYKNCSMVILPSFHEGFGLPIVEAQCHNAPIITSEGGCFEEAGGDAAIYINPHNPESLTEAIDKLYSDSTLREELIRKGEENIKRFDSKTLTKQVLDLYQS